MYFKADTVDDLMNEVLSRLLKLPFDVSPSKGKSSEIFGVLLELNNPRARLSLSETRGKAFSAVGELMWYLSKSNKLDFIEYYIPGYSKYSDDSITIHGGYGSRLFNMHDQFNQIQTVIDLLKKNKFSRRAVIQLFDAKDLQKRYEDVPCTCSLQFVIRDGKLHLYTSMRSNDAYLGLPHDIFSFTMLQEIIAKTLKVELGIYYHAVGSLHLYEDDVSRAEQYLNEGFQSTKFSMPGMPDGDPWESISILSHIEERIRLDEECVIDSFGLDQYFADLAYLLQVHSHCERGRFDEVENTRNKFSAPVFNSYIDKRIKNKIS